MILKALKKPMEVEILQWVGREREMYDFLTNTKDEPIKLEGETFEIKLDNGGCTMGSLYVKTLNGLVLVKINDYVIKGFAGEYYPCDKEAFDLTYDILT